jgi:hypothetical protein
MRRSRLARTVASMKRLEILVAVLALAGGCKRTKTAELAPTPGTASSGTGGNTGGSNTTSTAVASDTGTVASTGSGVGSCTTEATRLKTWITSVMNKSQRVAAPWPTGDAAFDAELAKLSAGAPKPDAPNLAWLQRVETRLDSELASCPQWATEREKAENVTKREDYRDPWPALADAIAACECKPSIVHVKALLYLRMRGPA